MFKYSPLLVRVRRFEKNYSVPFTATLIFLIILVVIAFMRYQDRSEMARIFENISKGGQDYAVLVSRDKTDEIKTETSGSNTQQTNATSSNRAITTSITSSNTTNPTPPPPPTPPPGTPPPPPPTPVPTPFTSSISYFRQEGSALDCPLLNLNSGNCKKTYSFGASIRTIGGPGTVQYRWISSESNANESRNFSVGGGEVFTSLNKSITLACNKSGPLTLQLAILSPTPEQSNVITVNHSC